MLLDINTILTACGCNFIVQQFNFQGNQRQDLFVLSMDSYPICNEGGDCDMTIKNCLSDSDKWILALALFLTTVKNDSSIKVVLMDDPVSSFDSDRKRIILKEIERVLNGTGKQLILLTHEKGFYQLLHAEYRNSTSSVFLKIVYDSTLGSNFAACNPMDDAEFMNDYNCWVFTMKNALTSQDLLIVREADANVRKVIEHILKVKYPIELATCQGTVGEMLTKLEEAGGPYSITSPRLDIEALLPNFSHHDNSSARSYPVSELGIEDYKSNIRGVFIAMKSL